MNQQYILDPVSKQNIENVRSMIQRKVSLIGKQNFYVQEKEMKGVVSDVDHLPYTRFYRGNPFTNEAIQWDGDSGHRPRMNSFYTPNIVQSEDLPESLCYQSPCSTVHPCYPEYLDKRDPSYQFLQDRYCVRRFV